MNRATKLALGMILPITALAGASSAGATAPPTVPPSEPPGTELGTPIPSDFVQLVDDTGTITVEVPGSWTDVDTAPNQDRPFIEAAPDRAAYNAGFDVPGVTYVAAPFNADTEAATGEFGLDSGCSDETVEPYDDGVFVGHELIYTGCGRGSAEFHVIAANPASQAFTALLRIQITGPEQLPILQGIKVTFNITAEAAATGSSSPDGATPTVVPPTAVAGGAFPPPTGEIPAGWTTLVDETQTITIAVPSSWTATDVAPAPGVDGSPEPWISATTDAALFFPAEGVDDTFSVPGVIYRAASFRADTIEALAASTYNDLCIPDPIQTYDDGLFAGHVQTFNQCGGTPAGIVQVVANPADQAFTAVVLIQLTGQPDDADTLNGVLLSFRQVSVDGAPVTPTTTTTAAATITTAAAATATTSTIAGG